MTSPRVSVVIPTLNGARTLPALLEALSAQVAPVAFETVAVDSGSSDGTVDLLHRRVDRLVEVPQASFNHGTTRNVGIEHARGDLIVLLVQDAVPASDGWLAALVAPFATDPLLAGAFARQQPRPGASALARHYLSQWVASSDVFRTMAIPDPAGLAAMTPMERFLACAFDNVCSCIRRAVWREHPFPTTAIAEDLAWAREVLLAGYRIAFVPEAVVVHSHDRGASYEFTRTLQLHRRLFELFELRTIPSVPLLLHAIAGSIPLHLRCAREDAGGRWRWKGLGRALALGVAWPMGQYLGGLMGWHERRLTRR